MRYSLIRRPRTAQEALCAMRKALMQDGILYHETLLADGKVRITAPSVNGTYVFNTK